MAVVAGLWLFDSQGREVFSPFTSNVTALGVVSTGKSNGSISHPLFARGRPVIISALPEAGTSFTIPDIVISGNMISWTFNQSGANYNQPVRLAFGVRA